MSAPVVWRRGRLVQHCACGAEAGWDGPDGWECDACMAAREERERQRDALDLEHARVVEHARARGVRPGSLRLRAVRGRFGLEWEWHVWREETGWLPGWCPTGLRYVSRWTGEYALRWAREGRSPEWVAEWGRHNGERGIEQDYARLVELAAGERREVRS